MGDYTWYFHRYKPNAFVVDQKATCRQCGQGIYFVFEQGQLPDALKRRTRGTWMHEGMPPGDWEKEEHHASPKEFCEESVTTSDYDYCSSPVKYEDIRAGNYACGRHMRKWEEELNYRKRQQEEQAKRAEREALEAYEVSQYEAAAEWIRANGFESLIGKYIPKERYGRFNRCASVDVFRLMEFLQATVRKLSGEESIEAASDLINAMKERGAISEIPGN